MVCSAACFENENLYAVYETIFGSIIYLFSHLMPLCTFLVCFSFFCTMLVGG